MIEPENRDPELIWTEADEPRSARFGDVYFSAEDGLAESRAVFLRGCDLPRAWEGRSSFTVVELGFGSGLNIVALLDLWQQTRPAGARMHVFSIEGYPLTREEARRALAAWPEVAGVSSALLDAWPPAKPGFHRIDLSDLGAVVDVAVGDVEWALAQWTGKADAWFLDGFAPSVNPAMWSDRVLDLIAARSAPDARLGTFTVAGAVRRGLAARGYIVDKRPGHGRKRERLEGRGSGISPGPSACPRVVVIGAGIAGASVVRALKASGIDPVLLETDRAGAGASGFPAALVTPRFDLGDPDVSALFAQALERARSLYDRIEGAVLTGGVLQMAGSPRDAARFPRIAAQPAWSEGDLRVIDGATASEILGEVVEGPGLVMSAAFTVAPAAILRAWLSDPAPPAHAHRIEAAGAGWRVFDADDGILAEADAVIVCGGAGTASLLPELALSPVRGQAEWCTGESGVAVAWGGYLAPTAEGLLFGATHDRGDSDSAVRALDRERNLATVAARLPALAERLTHPHLFSRAAIRATTRDRLPVAGQVPGRPGLFVLGGLGSRGFCLGPLLGEHVAALITGLASPLPSDVAQRICPSRTAVAPLASKSPEEDA